MRYIAIVIADRVTSVVVVDETDDLALVAEINNADAVIDVTDHTPRPGPGWTYSDDMMFRPAPPFQSWEWIDGAWQPPVAYPAEAGPWEWNEDTISWDRVTPDGE